MRIDSDKMRNKVREASTLLSAMSNEKRLMILCQLVNGEKSVGALAGSLDVRPSTISQHLALLRKDGFVVARRDGQTQYYSLADDEPRRLLEALYSIYCASGGEQPGANRQTRTTEGGGAA